MPDAPPATTAPRWGLGDAALGWLIAVTAQQLAVTAYLQATGRTGPDAFDTIPLTAVALLELPLWVGLLGMPVYAARVKGAGIVHDFGLRFQPLDAPVGFAIGVLAQWGLVWLIYLPILWVVDDADISAEARKLTDRAHGAGVLVLILVVVVGAPIVEEIFYRGLVLRALERRFGPPAALVLSSVAFGLAHFQLLQLPALVAFGFIAGYLTQRTGRLGPAIWAHAGFNAYTLFALLVLNG